MRILLIGEFSGVHNNLKKGLTILGHKVTLAADGDGYRGFGYDIRLTLYKGLIWGKIKNILYFLINLRKFIGYDVIQFINPFSLPYYYHYVGITSFLFKYNKKKIYYACGTDPAFLASKDKFKYFPFSDKNSTEIPHYSKLQQKYYVWFIKNISAIIPSMYTYSLGYNDNPKLKAPIPLPNSGNNSVFIPNQEKGKLRILFGITRREFKGAEFILEALEKIKRNYSTAVDITIVERLPFAEYIDLLRHTDVLIDQCKSYDYGMNAIFALENGCVVLSGCEKEAIEYLRIIDCPVINILPEIVDIYNKIECLIVNKEKLQVIKKRSFEFVNTKHSNKLISSEFINHYKELF